MKTLHIAIIAGSAISFLMFMSFFAIYWYNSTNAIHTGRVGAISPMELELTNITTEPSIVTVGNTFQIYASVNNTNPWPVTYNGGCVSPLTVSFDKNVQIQNGIGCYAISSEVINPGQVAQIHGPSTGLLYNGTSIGASNATITFSYQARGSSYNVTVSKQIAIMPPAAPPLYEQLKLAKMYVSSTDHTLGIRLDCKKPIGLQMKSIDGSIDVQKATALAYTSPEFVAKVNKYGTVSYNSFFNDWVTGDPCNTIWKSVEMVFSTTDANGYARNIQVSEDVDLTRVLNVTEYQSGFMR